MLVPRSSPISGGHKIVPIEWDVKKPCWSLSPVIHRQKVTIDNNVFPQD